MNTVFFSTEAITGILVLAFGAGADAEKTSRSAAPAQHETTKVSISS
jgi:hypothetical protein